MAMMKAKEKTALKNGSLPAFIYLSPVFIILYAFMSAAIRAEPMNLPITGALQELVYLELADRIK
jgi:hypothetical protein